MSAKKHDPKKKNKGEPKIYDLDLDATRPLKESTDGPPLIVQDLLEKFKNQKRPPLVNKVIKNKYLTIGHDAASGVNVGASGQVRITGSGRFRATATAKHFHSHEPIMLFIDPGEADAKDIANLYSALNDLYQHFGGSQLKFVNNGTKILAEEGVVA